MSLHYNVTLWRVRVTIVAMETQQYVNNTHYPGVHVKYPIFLLHFNQTRTFSRDFHEVRIPNYIQWKQGCSCGQSNGRHGKLTDAFRVYANAPRNQITVNITYCGPGQLSRYSDSLWDGPSEDRIPVGARFRTRLTGPGAHPASYTKVNESLSRR